MDRSVLEGDPHSLIEGMIIGGFAIGAHEGFVYVRAEYPLAIERLEHAIEQAREYGLLGKNILGSGFDFDLEIRMGAGAFVCGEETALMASIEGSAASRGRARRSRPSAASGASPRVLNNVETFANIAPIILQGRGLVRQHRHREQQGHQGLRPRRQSAATPASSRSRWARTLREIIFDIGGGIPNGKTFKAVQIGGPSGGCIPGSTSTCPSTTTPCRSSARSWAPAA